MGNSRWSSSLYSTRSVSYETQTREEIFQNRSIRKDFDPSKVTIRESVDSKANPESTALILALDVTGSMGMIAEKIARKGLGTLIEGVLDKKPVTDPHIMVMAIGDARFDDAPLQVSQFEADISIVDQLTDLWLEGGGGGNQTESYELAWAFAAEKTKIDCFDKRNKKGYLFTIGDENVPEAAGQVIMERVGFNAQNATAEQLLEEAQKRYNVFHVIVEEGNHVRSSSRLKDVYNNWTNILEKKVILLDDHSHISEVILSVIEVSEGADPEETITHWQDKSVQDSVRHALFGAPKQ